MNTDLEWEEWGRTDPYFGVITLEKYRSANLTEEAKAEFFRSGKGHVSHVLTACRRHLDPSFSPRRVLEFGCGVGRLVIPFAEVAEHVVGLDVSDSMLSEARMNCDRRSVTNVSLLKSDDDLAGLDGRFDLIHSCIVFQHIPTDRGRHILGKLLGHLSDGGIGAIQVTYAKTVFARTFGIRPPDPLVRESLFRRMRRELRRRTRSLAGRGRLPGRETPVSEPARKDPEMQMNSYNMNEILFIIQSAGVRNMYLEMTDHGGELGVFLYFQKPKKA